MNISSLPEMAVQLGLSVALVLFFVWQSSQREQRMSAIIDEMREFQRTELARLNDATVAALTNNTEAFRESVRVSREVCETIQKCRLRNEGG